MSVVVLMYHGLYRDARELQAIAPADRPYALPLCSFERHLALLEQAGLPVLDPAALPRSPLPGRGVVITFDDGHASQHALAMPALLRRGLRAAFFVTTGFIGTAGYCCAQAVAELARQGMTVGSHGLTHAFLDGMSDVAARRELALSRSRLQALTGQGVDQVSFPGGRYSRATVSLGLELGYRVFHTSRAGSLAAGREVAGGTVRRVALRAGTADEDFLQLASAARWPLWRAGAVSGLKRCAQRLLGNGAYHKLYEKYRA